MKHQRKIEATLAVPPPINDKFPASTKSPSVAGYAELELLAEGGQVVVYRAIQTSTRQLVVIKFTKPSAHGAPIARHQREIAVLARLQHPNSPYHRLPLPQRLVASEFEQILFQGKYWR